MKRPLWLWRIAMAVSLPTRERELKPDEAGGPTGRKLSLPTRERELKLCLEVDEVGALKSLPTRERELKHLRDESAR